MGKLHNHESKSEPDRRGKGVAIGEHPQLTSKAKLSYCHNWADNWSLGSIVIQTLMEDSLRLSPCRYQIFAEYVNREVMCLTHVNCRRRYPSLRSYFF